MQDGPRVRAMPPRVRGERGERDPRPEDPPRVRGASQIPSSSVATDHSIPESKKMWRICPNTSTVGMLPSVCIRCVAVQGGRVVQHMVF